MTLERSVPFSLGSAGNSDKVLMLASTVIQCIIVMSRFCRKCRQAEDVNVSVTQGHICQIGCTF